MNEKKTRQTYQARRVYGSQRTNAIVANRKDVAKLAAAILMGMAAFTAVFAAIYAIRFGAFPNSPQVIMAAAGLVAGAACAVYGDGR